MDEKYDARVHDHRAVGESRYDRETSTSAPHSPHNGRVPSSVGEATANSACHGVGAGCTVPPDGTNRPGDLLVKRQDMVSHPPAIENPADALPLLALAEALGAVVAVKACLAYIAAEENAVIDATRRYFCDTTTSTVVDWARAVHRLARWPPRTRQQQVAHPSKLFPPMQLLSTPILRSLGRRQRVEIEGAECFAGDVAQAEIVRHGEDVNTLAPVEGDIHKFRNSGNPSCSRWSSEEEAVPNAGMIGVSSTSPIGGDECREQRQGGGLGIEGGDRRTPPQRHNRPYQGSELECDTCTRIRPTPRPPTPPLTPPPPSPISHPMSRIRRFQPTVQMGDRVDNIHDTTRQRLGGADAIHATYSAMADKGSRGRHRPEAPRQSSARSPVAEDICDGQDDADAGVEENSLDANVCDCDINLLTELFPAAAFAPSGRLRKCSSCQARGPTVGKERCQYGADSEYARYGNDDPAGVVLEDSETTTSLSDGSGSGKNVRRTTTGSVRGPSLDGISEPTIARRFGLPVDNGAAYQYDRSCEILRSTVANRLVEAVVASPDRRAQQSTGEPTLQSSAGATFALAMLEEDERSCALARKRALLRVRLARQRQDLAGAVADANERGFRAERRRRRDEKVAALLIKTCGGGEGEGGGGDGKEWAESYRRGLGGNRRGG